MASGPERQDELAAPLPAPGAVDAAPFAPARLATDSVLALQRSAGNQAVSRALAPSSPGDGELAFEHAVSGPAGELPRRREMEAAFGTSFADVRARAGGRAAHEGLAALGARAATRGRDVVFREASPAADLVAHELAHVVQQRQSGDSVACSGAGGQPAAERAAEDAAAAVRAGRPVPDVGSAAAGGIQLAVETAGGEWDTDAYAAIDDGHRFGANIDLKFTPKDPVIANNIGLTQTVRTLKATAAGGAVGTPDPAGPRNESLSLPAGSSDPGRAIDQGDGPGTLPNTNPLYAVENSPGNVSQTLGDVLPGGNFGAHASRRENPDGTFAEVAGHLRDGPRRNEEVPGQEWEHTFEATALAIDGPLANMYLGSVAWGWKRNALGYVSLDPSPIEVVREGSPTAAFMDAAQRWNAATFTDTGTGTVHNTVDLPIVGVDAGALSTFDLYAKLVDVIREAAALSGPAKVCKDFEARTLERELKRRNVVVSVNVIVTEDITGPDDVYVKLSGPLVHQTAARRLNDGDSHNFLVPLSALGTMPLTDPVQVEVFDEDLFDADDLLVSMTWPRPYETTRNSGSRDGADYQVSVSYER